MQKTPDFMPEFRANLPRTGHSLSHDFHFTATTAHLNPIFHTIVSPGDKVKLGFDFNLRTMPLDSAAFASITTHTEYFFVPFSLLFQPFDSVYYGVGDQWSSLFPSNSIKRNFPVYDFNSAVSTLRNNRSSLVPNALNNVTAESIGQSAIRLFDFLGYCPLGISHADSEGTSYYLQNVFPYPLLAYHCIYQNYYRLDARESFDAKSFNWDNWFGSVTVPVGSYDPLKYCVMHYRPLDNDYFTDVKVSPIVDVLNLSSKSSLDVAKSWLSREDYQNASGVNHPVIGSGSIGQANSIYGFTGETVNNPSNSIVTKFGFNSNSSIKSQVSGSDVLSIPNGIDINTANIRALFANEKLWSITGRAKKDYDSQTLAHFGFTVPHDVKHEISCFGHDQSKIYIGEVISVSDTATAPLGEIAGKGYGQQNSQLHDFVAPCHGVIMAIFSVVIDRNYEAGIFKHNVLVNVSDLYQPEYDHLGMQPLFGFETNYYDYPSALSGGDPANVLGWQYRYEQWKRRYNRVSGAFRNGTGTLKSWCPTYVPYQGNNIGLGQTKPGNQSNTESYKNFQNFPTDGNQIFLANYPSSWSSSFESYLGWSHIYDFDPFVVSGHIKCTLISSMSDYSLPRLDA